MTGQTAFDYIIDYEEWIECGYFDDEIKARLKGKEKQRPLPTSHKNSLKMFSIFKLYIQCHLIFACIYCTFIPYSIQSEALKRPCEGDFQKSENDSIPPTQATISVHPDQLHPRYLPPPTDPHHNAVLLPLLCWNLRSRQRNSPGYKPSNVSGCGISD